MTEFEPFPKIGRLRRDCVVTEKIDGTNAQVCIVADGELDGAVAYVGGYSIYAGSRSRWLQPGKGNDNFGFAGWVVDNAAELVKLGEGRHYGEWWGVGIQRGYDLTERRFSLFNAYRWREERPSCCGVVPILYAGPFNTTAVDAVVWELERTGSVAKPDFMKPEGIIVYHAATKTYFKRLLENDEISKGEALAA
jgi:hypothetical protein